MIVQLGESNVIYYVQQKQEKYCSTNLVALIPKEITSWWLFIMIYNNNNNDHVKTTVCKLAELHCHSDTTDSVH